MRNKVTRTGAKSRERACSGLLWSWMAATGLELCEGHRTAKAIQQQSNPGSGPSHGKGLVRGSWIGNKVSPDWGQVTGKNLFAVTLVADGCYWFGALQGPLQGKSSSALTQTCLTSKEQSNPGLGPSHGTELVRGYFGRGWLLLVGALQTPVHCKSSSALPQTCLTSQEQSNPGLGPSQGKGLFGVTLDVDCYWFGALQGPLHCKSSSAFPRLCPTSEKQSIPGLGPSHGKGLVRGYFGRGWLRLAWSSARATALQKQFYFSPALPDK